MSDWLDFLLAFLIIGMNVGMPLSAILLPDRSAQFYRWYYGRMGLDQRRLDAMTPKRMRVGGLLYLACLVVFWLLAWRTS